MLQARIDVSSPSRYGRLHDSSCAEIIATPVLYYPVLRLCNCSIVSNLPATRSVCQPRPCSLKRHILQGLLTDLLVHCWLLLHKFLQRVIFQLRVCSIHCQFCDTVSHSHASCGEADHRKFGVLGYSYYDTPCSALLVDEGHKNKDRLFREDTTYPLLSSVV